MGRLQTGQCWRVCFNRRAHGKQQAWCPVDPCTMLAFLGAARHITHTDGNNGAPSLGCTESTAVDNGISANCVGISILAGKGGMRLSVLWFVSQLPGDIIPESKLDCRLLPKLAEPCDSTPLGKSTFSFVVRWLLTMSLLGSQSGRRFQQKPQYRCRGLFSVSHIGHTHLSCSKCIHMRDSDFRAYTVPLCRCLI